MGVGLSGDGDRFWGLDFRSQGSGFGGWVFGGCGSGFGSCKERTQHLFFKSILLCPHIRGNP